MLLREWVQQEPGRGSELGLKARRSAAGLFCGHVLHTALRQDLRAESRAFARVGESRAWGAGEQSRAREQLQAEV